MNSQEQQRRHTAVTRLEADMETVIDGVIRSTGEQLEALKRAIDQVQSALDYEIKRTRQLELEQRSYVDGADRELRQVADERWFDVAREHQRILASMVADTEPLRRGFFGRWRHLLTGR